jgi:mono/diheme cytochrome c family protein
MTNGILKRFSTSFAVLVFTLSSLSVAGVSAQGDAAKGEGLYNANCASCHHPEKKSTGPALKGARQRWIDKSSEENFYKWVQNNAKLRASGDAYANAIFNEWGGSIMNTFETLSNDDIDDIMAYVEAWVPPVVAGGGAGDGVVVVEEDSNTWVWIVVLITFFIVIAFSMGSVKRQLATAVHEAETGEKTVDDRTYLEVVKDWAWNNKKWATLIVAIFLLGGLNDLWSRALLVGVFEDYEPSQPIAFSHKIHAGQLEIDCQYCHNSASKSKHAGIPSVNVCMNCHTSVQEGKRPGSKDEIAKIHAAAGFDADAMKYLKNPNPIVWNKAHNLPDHVYFNHSQHVVVGQIDCIQCHGDVKTYELGKVTNVNDINKLEGTIKLDRPLLTMGWCIQCHDKTEVKMAGSEYYDEIHRRLKERPELLKKYLDDDKINVKELGGWECGKCHY